MFTVIDNDEKLIKFRKHLQKNEIAVISMDFEGEFNLHHYGEKLCLIQVYDGRDFYIIDPFQVSTDELKRTLESRVIKLFYDAGSDRMLVYKQYGIKIKSILDLKIFVDVLQFEKKSLGAVLSELFNIEIQKKKNFQRYNWVRRPIDEDAIYYALSDVEHLFRLKDELIRLIQEKNKAEQLLYSFAGIDIDYDKKSIPGIKKNKAYISLNADRKNKFDRILNARENIARRIDRPPNFVFSNDQVFKIVQNRLRPGEIIFGKGISNSLKDDLKIEIEKILN